MRKYLKIALRNLLKHRTRTLIMACAIMSVTAVMVILFALTEGIKSTIIENGTVILSGHVNVAGFYKINQTSAAPIILNADVLEKIARENTPEALQIFDRVKGYGKVISENTSIQVPLWGVNIEKEGANIARVGMAPKSDYLKDYVPKPGESAYEGRVEDLQNRNSIVLFAAQARKLSVRVGDMVTVSVPTYRNMSNTIDVKVVAILHDLGLLSTFSVFMNAKDLKETYQIKDTTSGQIMIFLKSLADVPKVEERLRKVYAQKGYKLLEKDARPFFMKFEKIAGESWTGERLDVTTWMDETSFLQWIVDIINVFTWILTIVLMVIVVLGLINTLWISIRERTNEVGTLRAIGLPRKSVMLMFLLEAMILSVVATFSGILCGTLVTKGLDMLHLPITSEAFLMILMSDALHFKLVPGTLLMIFGVISFFVSLGALFPAYAASKLKPITAINYIK